MRARARAPTRSTIAPINAPQAPLSPLTPQTMQTQRTDRQNEQEAPPNAKAHASPDSPDSTPQASRHAGSRERRRRSRCRHLDDRRADPPQPAKRAFTPLDKLFQLSHAHFRQRLFCRWKTRPCLLSTMSRSFQTPLGSLKPHRRRRERIAHQFAHSSQTERSQIPLNGSLTSCHDCRSNVRETGQVRPRRCGIRIPCSLSSSTERHALNRHKPHEGFLFFRQPRQQTARILQ